MYYSILAKSSKVFIDGYENFKKQSYRNRCVISSPNGPLKLIIPVIRISKNIVKDVKIDNNQNWRKIHWKSLESSYRSSPYFEFYEDEFKTLYFEKKLEYLLDFNNQVNLIILRCLNIDTEISFSSSYIENDGRINDFRDVIHPSSKPADSVKKMKYSQVFQESQEFIYNLSIFDLLFNQGPMAKQLLDS
tara:strand:+ start:93 stop:662 length:570 start_codon:yes stop_codon:yes gene_type:complete